MYGSTPYSVFISIRVLAWHYQSGLLLVSMVSWTILLLDGAPFYVSFYFRMFYSLSSNTRCTLL